MHLISRKSCSLLLFTGAFFIVQSAIVKPNPIISRGSSVTVKVSSGDAAGINDNKFGQYAATKWSFTDNSWAAIKVASGTYSKVFITWNCPDTSWSDNIAGDSCKKNIKVPVDYTISTSSNSTTGADGDWTIVETVTGNSVTARGHLIDFSGATWVKMNISKGSGKIDEIEVFDASNGAEDTWFFLGTRITALMFKGAMNSGYTSDKNVPDSNFAAMIKMRNPTFTPALIRGGVFCGLKSGDIANNISKYLAAEGNVHFWAIEIGTYDAWGGKTDSLASFKKNLQIIVDSCKAHQIQPVIARICGTNPQKLTPSWQIHKDFLAAVDTITKTNKLIPGANLYAYTTTGLGNLDLGNDGVLPNDYGDFELQREWAKKMDTVVYKATVKVFNNISESKSARHFTALSQSGRIIFTADLPGTITLFSTNGRIIKEIRLSGAGSFSGLESRGFYLVKFCSKRGVEKIKVFNY